MTRLFGTDGIRAKVGTYPFTHDGITVIATSIGQWLAARGYTRPVLIARDTRPSGADIAQWVHAGLHAHGIPTLDAGIVPTPAAVMLADSLQYDYALVISASHNPVDDNGIKILHARQGKLDRAQEAEIEEIITQYVHAEPPLRQAQGERATRGAALILSLSKDVARRREAWAHTTIVDATHIYKTLLEERYPFPSLVGKLIVLDGAHGAASTLAHALLVQAGAHVIQRDTPLDGNLINNNCGATCVEPLQALVLTHQAFLGVAFDGDGDRLILVDAHGTIRTGDDILYLLLRHPTYHDTPAVIGTLMSNQGAHQAVHALGKTFVRTPVGDAYVAQGLREHGALLGGEPAGHILLADVGPTGDALVALARVLQTLALTDGHWPTFTPYPQELYKIPVARPTSLAQEPYAGIIARAQELIPQGQLVVRYSGTEHNTLRIMIQAPTQEDIARCKEFLQTHLLPIL